MAGSFERGYGNEWLRLFADEVSQAQETATQEEEKSLKTRLRHFVHHHQVLAFSQPAGMTYDDDSIA